MSTDQPPPTPVKKLEKAPTFRVYINGKLRIMLPLKFKNANEAWAILKVHLSPDGQLVCGFQQDHAAQIVCKRIMIEVSE